jgi:adenylyl-sulfate kinase
MVIWTTGLSGAGKTTLAVALHDLLKPSLPQTVLIDGDTIREAFGKSLGFSEADRVTQITRVQRLAKILADQNLIVIVAALYSHSDLLNWNRKHLKGYFEVYLDASMELLHRRDQKGLYSMAASGKATEVVGIDIPWNAPAKPDLLLRADDEEPPHEMAVRVLAANPEMTGLMARAAD